VGRISY